MSEAIEISTDLARLDVPMVHQFLTETYWARGRTMSEVVSSIRNSMSFGLYLDDNQVGFGRVVTDRIAIAYLMDVFVLPDFRRRGLGTKLVHHILRHPDLAEVQTWMLKTKDSRSLYERCGFRSASDSGRLMSRTAPCRR